VTKKQERPAAIPIDVRNWDALRYVVGGRSGAAKTIGKLLENRIMDTRRPGQSMDENLAPASELLAEVRALNDELQRGLPHSWRDYVRAHPPSPEAIALLVFVGHETLLKSQTRMGAGKANEPMATAKAWMLEKWRQSQGEFESKTKFAESFQPILKKEKGVQVTVKTIVDRWLKGH
jgi:hypothetical protein